MTFKAVGTFANPRLRFPYFTNAIYDRMILFDASTFSHIMVAQVLGPYRVLLER